MPEIDPQFLHQGRRRLRQMLPAARAEVGKGPFREKSFNGLAKAVLPFLTEDNLEALAIVPGAKGGWCADLVLKHVPPGVMNTIGTPVQTPFATKAEAVEAGIKLLIEALSIEQETVAAKDAPPVFMLCGDAYPLSPDLLAKMAASPPRPELNEDAIAASLERLVGVVRTLKRESPFIAATMQATCELIVITHAAALLGIMRYPPVKAEPPNPHTAAASKVH